ncbi:MAG: hypothetical protein WDW38_004843 [Sanguina aurantia]
MGAKAFQAQQALMDGSNVGTSVRPSSALRTSHQANAAAVRGSSSSAHATQQNTGISGGGGGGRISGGGDPGTQALSGDGVGAMAGLRPVWALDINTTMAGFLSKK